MHLEEEDASAPSCEVGQEEQYQLQKVASGSAGRAVAGRLRARQASSSGAREAVVMLLAGGQGRKRPHQPPNDIHASALLRSSNHSSTSTSASSSASPSPHHLPTTIFALLLPPSSCHHTHIRTRGRLLPYIPPVHASWGGWLRQFHYLLQGKATTHSTLFSYGLKSPHRLLV